MGAEHYSFTEEEPDFIIKRHQVAHGERTKEGDKALDPPIFATRGGVESFDG